MRLLPHAAQAIRVLNKEGFSVIINTNQTVVAWGQVSEKKLRRMHETLVGRLRAQGAQIDAVYYCPHHPEAPLKTYRKICGCRKPKIGMLRAAAKKYDIDIKNSYMVGDSSKDILAGKRAGVKTILVKTGNAGKESGAKFIIPDYSVKNLLAAARLIKRKARGLWPRA